MLFVSHRRQQVTVVSRNGSAWDTREYRPGQFVEIAALSLTFALDELYADIALDDA